jgi:hypothetical protein
VHITIHQWRYGETGCPLERAVRLKPAFPLYAFRFSNESVDESLMGDYLDAINMYPCLLYFRLMSDRCHLASRQLPGRSNHAVINQSYIIARRPSKMQLSFVCATGSFTQISMSGILIVPLRSPVATG